jgi:very-short-patch-repair endonuclease
MSQPTKEPVWQVTRTTRSRARRLRRDLTNAERIVWNALRAHRMMGASFRRQTPVGPYIVAKLIIEIDGGQHFEPRHQKRDARRDAFLASSGYRVPRFNNYGVTTNRAGVLEVIAAALDRAPSPPLPRKRGREQAGTPGEAN